jgi:hypothetical protein
MPLITDLQPSGTGDSASPLAGGGGSVPQTTPAPSSTQPTSTPQFSGPPSASSQAQAVMADLNSPQPTQTAPVYTPPTLSGQPSFFGRLLQGALNGLSGGLLQGQENVAGAGTAGFTPGGNGISYAQKLQAAQDEKQSAADKAKQDQAQQQFENDKATFQMQQQQTMQKVQAAQAKLNGIHIAQQIQHADEDAQSQYYTGQENQRQSIMDGGGKEIAHLTVQPGQNMQDVGATYLKEHPELMTDPNTHITYARDANGETEVHVMSGDPNARITSDQANAQLKSLGSDRTLPADTTMTRHDFNALYGSEAGKVADQHNKVKIDDIAFQRDQQLQAEKEASERQIANMKEAGENSRASAKTAGGGGNEVQTIAEGIANGSGQTLNNLDAKTRAQVSAYLTEHHPNLDQTSVNLNGPEQSRRDLAQNGLHNLNTIKDMIEQSPDLIGKMQGRLSQGKKLLGTDDPRLGTIDAALDAYGMAVAGAHGVKAQQARKDAEHALLNGLKNGPDATNAAINTMAGSLNEFASTGRPKGANGSAYITVPQGNGQPLTDRSVAARIFAKVGASDPTKATPEQKQAARKLAAQNGWKF